MTTSGTIGQTVITVQDLVIKSILRCGKKSSEITPEMLDQARQSMYFYIMSLSNLGVNLWTIEKLVIAVNPFQPNYNLPLGTIEILNAMYRISTPFSDSSNIFASSGTGVGNLLDQDVTTTFTETSPNGNIYINLGQQNTPVLSIGIMSNGTTTYNFVLEGSNDNSTWTQIQALGAQSFPDQQFSWFDITSPSGAQYFRLRETGGATISLRQLYFATYFTEYNLTRMSRDTYTSLPNKLAPAGWPLQYWYNRIIPQPQLVVWPVGQDYFSSQMVIWRSRQIQDIGAFTNSVEMPDRWAEALISNVAPRLALELEGVDPNRIQLLAALATSAENIASMEERDKSEISMIPNITGYTR